MQVLIADDDRTSRNILEIVLTQLGYEVTSVSNGKEALGVLKDPKAPNLVILDWMMPEMSGIETCSRLRQLNNPETVYTYIIMLTAKGSNENIVEGMEAGADDYIVKPFEHNELRVRLNAGRRIIELHEELLKVKKELFEQSRTDPLTGLLNRRAVLPIVEKEYSRCIRSRETFAISLLDVDHFKAVNDQYGHPAGDAVLKEIACRINHELRDYDSVGRFGGEEFLIVLPGVKASDTGVIGERIRKSICKKTMPIGRLEIEITVSQGMVNWDGNSTVQEMIKCADEALYHAKKAGRNRVTIANVSPNADKTLQDP